MEMVRDQALVLTRKHVFETIEPKKSQVRRRVQFYGDLQGKIQQAEKMT